VRVRAPINHTTFESKLLEDRQCLHCQCVVAVSQRCLIPWKDVRNLEKATASVNTFEGVNPLKKIINQTKHTATRRLLHRLHLSHDQGPLRRFRDPIRVPRISNRVPRIRENYHWVPKIRENLVPTRYLMFSLKKTCIRRFTRL